MNADANRDPDSGTDAAGLVGLGHRSLERQSRPHRPGRCVLERLRVPEVGEHAVADVVGDVATVGQMLSPQSR